MFFFKMPKLLTLSTKLNGEIEINFRYKYVYAFSEKVGEDIFLTIQILSDKQKEKTHNLKLLCLDFLAWIVEEGFMLYDVIQKEIKDYQPLPDIESSTVFVNGIDKLKDLDNLVSKWEKSDKKQRKNMLMRIRMNRYRIAENKKLN